MWHWLQFRMNFALLYALFCLSERKFFVFLIISLLILQRPANPTIPETVFLFDTFFREKIPFIYPPQKVIRERKFWWHDGSELWNKKTNPKISGMTKTYFVTFRQLRGGTLFFWNYKLSSVCRELYRSKIDSEFCRNSDATNKPHRTVLNNGGCSQGIPSDTATNFQIKKVLHTEILVAEHPVYIIFKRVNKNVPQNA